MNAMLIGAWYFLLLTQSFASFYSNPPQRQCLSIHRSIEKKLKIAFASESGGFFVVRLKTVIPQSASQAMYNRDTGRRKQWMRLLKTMN
jgi:hypothetical protein